MTGYEFENSSFSVTSTHNPVDAFRVNHESTDPPSLPTHPQHPIDNKSLGLTTDIDSSYTNESGDFYHAVLRFINDILMEEDLEDKPCMLQDCLALQAAEKSFYDVLGKNYPPSSNQFSTYSEGNVESADESFTSASSVDSSSSCGIADKLAKSRWISDQGELECSLLQSSHIYSPASTFLAPNVHVEVQPFMQFNEMMGNGSKSLPCSYPVNLSLMCKPSNLPEVEEGIVAHIAEKDGQKRSSNCSRGRKSHQREDNGYFEEGRSSKHSAVSTEESEQLEILDNIFLCKVRNGESMLCPLYDASRNEARKKSQHSELQQASNLRMKRQANDKEMTDLSTLLMQCAEAAGCGDQRTAHDKIRQIRQHSSPFGDENQRLAHYFANALEARLTGTWKLYCTPNARCLTPAADIIKAYQLYASIFPFRKMTNCFGNRTITKVAEGATTLHIIDFGISYGFQWPCLIHRLSTMPSGPPKIRITGIELPQPGFRPAERVEETGRRLKRLAERLNVPLEYNAIAQKWETIQYEDLKINRDEATAVNCMYRLRILPDDTIAVDSPRDTVLKLIKRINPDIFVHGVVNGTYNAPFFVTRFREALFHFSALFDMFEANAPRDDRERLVFEREIIANHAMNVIACEGTERIQRPETYKQWQIRNSRIGFKQIPLNQDIMKKLRSYRSDYHKDFVVDEDGHWMLLGWKGRIIQALSAWKPVQD